MANALTIALAIIVVLATLNATAMSLTSARDRRLEARRRRKARIEAVLSFGVALLVGWYLGEGSLRPSFMLYAVGFTFAAPTIYSYSKR